VIAVDSNILLRYLLADDSEQTVKARELIQNNRVLVTDVVLAETLWVLQGKKYRVAKSNLVGVLSALLEDARILFEDPSVVWRAYRDFATSNVDFSDALILHKARSVEPSANNLLYTFDQAVAELNHARMV